MNVSVSRDNAEKKKANEDLTRQLAASAAAHRRTQEQLKKQRLREGWAFAKLPPKDRKWLSKLLATPPRRGCFECPQ